MAAALIIVDVQNDFCEGGSFAVPNANQVIPVINAFREKFDLVYLSRDWHPADHVSFHANNPESTLLEPFTLENGVEQMMWPTHCVQNTPGADYHPDLARKQSDIPILKGTDRNVDAYSAFNNPDLLKDLKEKDVRTVYVVGLAWDYCVGLTAKDAAMNGFEVYFMTDATKPVDATTQEAMNKQLTDARVQFAVTTEVEAL